MLDGLVEHEPERRVGSVDRAHGDDVGAGVCHEGFGVVAVVPEDVTAADDADQQVSSCDDRVCAMAAVREAHAHRRPLLSPGDCSRSSS